MDALSAGTILGNYRIRRVAGRGAVGVVYEAEHVALGRTVAVKMLSREHADKTVFRQRFTREGRGAASVQHPNIITVFDAGEHEGTPYLVMDFVDGPDLEQVLAARGGRLPPSSAIGICRAVADALDAAASQGFAHRDVKPANILMERWGSGEDEAALMPPHVYLTDFGLIKSSGEVSVTQTGSFVGTLLYMSPEQIQGQAVPASDQYSLACVLWECLVGKPPFEPENGEPLSLLSAHLHAPPPRISDRSAMSSAHSLDDVFRRALAKDPRDRFGTAGAFVAAVAEALDTPASTVVFPVLDPTPPVPTDLAAGPGRPDGEAAAAGASLASGTPAIRDSTPGGNVAAAAAGDPAATARTQERVAPPIAPPPAGPPPQVPSAPGTPPPSGTPNAPPGPTYPAAGTHRSGQRDRARRRGLAALVLGAVLVAGVLAAVALRSTGDSTVDPGPVTSADAAVSDGPVVDPGQPTTAASDPPATPTDPLGADPLDVAALTQQGRVAFVGDDDIWVAHVDGRGAANVTQGQFESPRQPAWQPGREVLVFSSEDGLQLADLSAGDDAPVITSLTDDGDHSDPAWSPSGERLLVSVVVENDERDIAILEPGGTPQPIGLVAALEDERDRVIAQRPAWRPDEARIAFQLTDDDGPRVWTATLDGTEVAPLPGVPEGRAYHPQYRPAGGGTLLFSRTPLGSDVTELWLADPAAGQPQRLETTPGVVVENADFAPCGDAIITEFGTTSPTVDFGIVAAAGGNPSALTVPKPQGVTALSDPSWHGQGCA